MSAAPRFREHSRQLLRETLVTAARDLAVAHGWAGVTMQRVAAGAGVSRQTVYNEFDGKPALAEAVAAHEIERFVRDVRDRLNEQGADAHAAARAAILHTLTEAEGNPLVKAILTSARGADELLPFLTTRSDLVLHAATAVIFEWAGAHLTDVGEENLSLAAESVVRLAVSHIVHPTAPADRTALALADVFVRLLELPAT